MDKIDIQGMSYTGIQVGLGIAIIPVTATALIACSKIILINIIANTTLRILTANAFGVDIYGVSVIAVPLLWKISLVTAILGGVITVLSLLAPIVDSLYQKSINAN